MEIKSQIVVDTKETSVAKYETVSSKERGRISVSNKSRMRSCVSAEEDSDKKIIFHFNFFP